MQRYLLPLLFLALSFSGFAQSEKEYDYVQADSTDQKEKKLKVELRTGFGMSTGNNSTSFGTYVMPVISKELSTRFAVSAGLMYLQSFSDRFQNSPSRDQFRGEMQNRSSALLFVGGSYKLNEKLTINGSGYTNLDQFEQGRKPFRDRGMSIGLDYKVNKNLSFGLQYSIQEGNPYLPGAMGIQGYAPVWQNSSFQSTPFNSFPTW